MKPYEKIVVTTDLSDASKCAFNHAQMLATKCNSSLSLLYVIEDASLAKPGKFPGQAVLAVSDMYSQDEEQLEKELNEIVKTHFQELTPTVEILRTGKSPAEAVTEYLRSSKASLAVISSSGKKGIRRAVIGSVAEKIARFSPCPVLLITANNKD